jgi:hypothetical protein
MTLLQFLILPPFSENVTQNLINWTDEIKVCLWMSFDETITDYGML